MSYGTRKATAAEAVRDDLTVVAKRIRAIAHREENLLQTPVGDAELQRWRVVVDDQGTMRRGLEALRHTSRLEGWETRVTYTYTREQWPRGAVIRHLSISIRVPGRISQGELNMPMGPDAGALAGKPVRASLVPLLEPIVRVWFPFHLTVQCQFRALPPVPVADPRTGQAVFVTPLVIHVLVDEADLAGLTVGGTVAPILYDAEGAPIVDDAAPDPLCDALRVLGAEVRITRKVDATGERYVAALVVGEGMSADVVTTLAYRIGITPDSALANLASILGDAPQRPRPSLEITWEEREE